ncbi:aromatic ring-hydroxylating dioxygenase subunit alpha [Actinomycetes bacterium KLBMP 9759]
MTGVAVRGVGPNQLLPPSTYFEPEWYEREQAELFSRTWRYVGPADEFGKPGSYRSVQVGRHPLVVVRGHDGSLRAFHNVCRHRGAAVLPGDGRVEKNIVCPFHNWTYGLDGCLLAVTQRNEIGKQLDRSKLSLHRASLGVWRGLVFVHPDPDAQPLVEWLGELPEHLAPYGDITRLVEPVAGARHDVKCNWKVFVEGALDNYHLGYVHAENLASMDHKRQEQRACAPRHWFFYEPPKVPGQLPPEETKGGLRPLFEDPRWYGSSYGLIFPNLFVLTGATYWASAEIVPTGPETTSFELRARIAPGNSAKYLLAGMRELLGQTASRAKRAAVDVATSVRAGDRDSASLLAALRKGKKLTVAEEDVFCAESVQRGLRSPKYSVGPIAHRYEHGIQDFQRNVMAYVPLEGPAA